MLHGSSSPGIAGSELARVLARWSATARPPGASSTDGPALAGQQAAFAERLGQWIGWTDAIALATALRAQPAACGNGAGQHARAGRTELQQLQTALAAAIARDPEGPAASPTDFAPYRRHCLALQQAMHDATAPLRRRLRDAVASRSVQLARLAAIDAALDSALGAQQRSLLALVPLRLRERFEFLHGQAAADDCSWIHTFRHDMQQLLLAELAHRLLPLRGLLDALHDDAHR